ncbi:MAG: DUF2163 domain-containing protein [Hyphomicrobiaceae bacterium]
MRDVPSTLTAALQNGVTTLSWCWRIAPRHGAALGFTDHDRDIELDGTVFEAASGFTASEIRSAVGLAVDDLDVESALTSERLSEASLSAGDFDDATIEIFRVDWSNPNSYVLVKRGSLGEVRRSGSAFAAEVRGLTHYLQQPQGRVFQVGCDAELGDRRCGVDLSDPLYRAEGSVAQTFDDRTFSASGLASFAADWFTRGRLTFTAGENVGRSIEVRRHSVEETVVRMELWQPPGRGMVAGDGFIVTAGCDKQLATCRDRFGNSANHRGFPAMPGNDFLSSPPVG